MTISDELKKVLLFSGLSDTQRAKIAASCQRRIYADNIPLFRKGDTDGHLYIVLKGGFKVCCVGQDGQETIMALYGVGEVFGETALLANSPCVSTAITIAEKTELLILNQAHLADILRDSFELTQALLLNMAVRLEADSLNGMSANADNSLVRVAKLLVARVDPVTGKLAAPLTQKEFAETIGTRRETVARNLAKLEDAGILARNQGDILIHSMEDLQKAGRPG